MALEFLGKAVTLNEKQYNGMVFVHSLLGEMIDQASPTDETPLSLSVMESLEVIGGALMGKLPLANSSQKESPKK